MSSTPPQRDDHPSSGTPFSLRPEEGTRSRHLRVDSGGEKHSSIHSKPRSIAAETIEQFGDQADASGRVENNTGFSSESGVPNHDSVARIDKVRIDNVRIDSDHGVRQARPSGARKPGARRSPTDSATAVRRTDSELQQQASSPPVDNNSERHRWLRLHASDLIERIQHWSDSVDSRESMLNARTAQQERRERQFRLKQQDLAVELDEQRRSIERLRRELETQTRRLAFLDSV